MISTDECINVGLSEYLPDVSSLDILGVYGFVFANSRINIVVSVVDGGRLYILPLTEVFKFREVLPVWQPVSISLNSRIFQVFMSIQEWFDINLDLFSPLTEVNCIETTPLYVSVREILRSSHHSIASLRSVFVCPLSTRLFGTRPWSQLQH